MENLDPTAIDRISEAIQAGDWSSIAGLALLLLATAAGYVLRGKLSDPADGAISILRGAASGIGVGLVSTAAAGGEWWLGLAIGTFGLLASAGFLDLVRAAIPDRSAQ